MAEKINRRESDRRWIRPAIAIGVAATALLLGYGDLWRGGSSVSAILLTVGYMILVPIAIMTGPRTKLS